MAQQPQPTLKAVQSDQLVGDANKNGRVDPGDTIRYTVVIANCGPVDAQNVILNENLDPDTTFVTGSVKALGQSNISTANCAPIGVTATPVPGATNTPGSGPTATPSQTATLPPLTFTPSITNTATATIGTSPTNTPSNTAVSSATNTATNTATFTPSPTSSATSTATVVNTATFTPSITNTPPVVTLTPSNTLTNTATVTPSFTPSATNTVTNTATLIPSLTPSNTPSLTATFTPSATDTATNTATLIPSLTPSNTPTNTATVTPSLTATLTPSLTNTATNTATFTPSVTPSNTPTHTATVTFTPLPTGTATNTATLTPSNTVTNTATVTPSNTATDTPTQTHTATFTPSNTPTSTLTNTPTNTPTNTSTPTPTPCPMSADTYTAVGNVLINVNPANGVFANDGCSTPITQINGSGVSGVATVTTTQGGTLSIDTTTGAFDYNPPVGYGNAGGQADTFTYFRTGAATSVTVTITVYTPIWFIDDSAVGGDGRFTDITGTINTAFNSIAAFNGSSSYAAGDYVFIYSGNYGGTAGITMQSNLVVIGQASSLLSVLNNLGTYSPFTNFNVLTLAPYTVSSLATNTGASTSPVLGNTSGNTFTLAGTNNYIDSVTITQNAGTAIGGTGAGGTSYIRNVPITGTASARLLNLTTQSGTLTFTNGSLVASSTTSDAVTFTNNAATVNINNPMNLLVSGARGLVVNNAASGGTLNITDGTSNVAVNNATAIDINNSAIGITLHDVNKAGATQPTYGLSITNSTGTFVVTGTATTAASGGLTANVATSGIRLDTSANLAVSLSNMQLTNANTTTTGNCNIGTNHADCRGALDVRNLSGTSSVTTTKVNVTTAAEVGMSFQTSRDISITNSTISGTGAHGIFGRALAGNITITETAGGTSQISGYGGTVAFNGRGIYMRDMQNGFAFTLANTSIAGTNNAFEFGAFYVDLNTGSTGTVNVTGNTFQNTGAGSSTGLVRLNDVLSGANNAILSNLQITNNSFTRTLAGGAEGLVIQTNGAVGDTPQITTFNVGNNTFDNMANSAINISTLGTTSLTGRVQNNIITNANTRGITIGIGDQTTGNIYLLGNQITTNTATAMTGIFLRAANATSGSPRIDFNVDNNTVTDANTGNTGTGILVNASSFNVVCLDANGNSAFVGGAAFAHADFVSQRAGTNSTMIHDGWNGVDTYLTYLTNKGNTVAAAGGQVATRTGTHTAGTCAANPPLPPPLTIPVPVSVVPARPMVTTRNGNLMEKWSAHPVVYIAPANRGNMLAALPINIGTIPAGKQVTLTFDVVVNKPILKDYVSAQGTVTGSNFTSVLTDDPDTSLSNDPTITPIDLSSVKLPATGERAWWRDLSPWWGVAVGVLLVGLMLGIVSRRLRNR